MKRFTKSIKGRVILVASGAATLAASLTGCGISGGVTW